MGPSRQPGPDVAGAPYMRPAGSRHGETAEGCARTFALAQPARAIPWALSMPAPTPPPDRATTGPRSMFAVRGLCSLQVAPASAAARGGKEQPRAGRPRSPSSPPALQLAGGVSPSWPFHCELTCWLPCSSGFVRMSRLILLLSAPRPLAPYATPSLTGPVMADPGLGRAPGPGSSISSLRGLRRGEQCMPASAPAPRGGDGSGLPAGVNANA